MSKRRKYGVKKNHYCDRCGRKIQNDFFVKVLDAMCAKCREISNREVRQ